MKRLLAFTLLTFYAALAFADGDLNVMRDEAIANFKRFGDDRFIERQSVSQEFITQQTELSEKICLRESNHGNKSITTNRDKLFFDNLVNQLHELTNINESKFEVFDKKSKNFLESNEKILKDNCQDVTWQSGASVVYLCIVKGPTKKMSVLNFEIGNIQYRQIHLLELDSLKRLMNCTSKSKLRKDNDMKEYLSEKTQFLRTLNEKDYDALNYFYELVTNFGHE